MADTILISADEMKQTLFNILLKYDFNKEKALTLAEIFTSNSVDGVYSHGVNRFGRFVEYIKDGHIKIEAEPILVQARQAIEQWDGQFGPGPLNALHATHRSMEIAQKFGLGCVALAHNNHWMRGGYYGWEAAKAGYAFIGWTNTIGNMPAWNAIDRRLGNNPLVMAVPYQDEAIVLDMAMSQFSFGKMEMLAMKHEQLPVAGGYDDGGNLTTDPEAIIQSGRFLPIGYWKGAGLSFVLDVLATILSAGMATHEISNAKLEWASQVFIAINLSQSKNYSAIGKTIEAIVKDYHQSTKVSADKTISYPGEGVLAARKKNLENGIPVVKKVWDEIIKLAEA